jgi:hypothetical protein
MNIESKSFIYSLSNYKVGQSPWPQNEHTLQEAVDMTWHPKSKIYYLENNIIKKILTTQEAKRVLKLVKM